MTAERGEIAEISVLIGDGLPEIAHFAVLPDFAAAVLRLNGVVPAALPALK